MTSEAPAAAASRPTDDAVLELQREEGSRHVARWGTTGLLAAGFLALSGAALALPGHRGFSAVAIVTSLVAYAIASRVELEFPGFVAIPTEAVFVAMWFVLPVRLLPLAVCAAMLLGRLPEVVSRRMPPDRLAVTIVSCWYAVGPALVLYLAGPKGPRWQDVPIYVAALGAQFVFDYVSNFALVWAVLRRSPLAHLRSALFAYAVDAALAPLGLLAAFPVYRHSEAMLLLLPVLLLASLAAADRKDKNTKVIELLRAYKGTALLLGEVIEADDEYTGTHSRDVVELVRAVAARLRLPDEQQDLAEFSALLHDVGKVKIPPSLINKAGPLDADERTLMNSHAILGEQMLVPIGGLLGEVGKIVRSCHERWDGTGYPDGLAREEIPLLARIVGACDAWSAMTTDRPYRPALSREAATAELFGGAGTQFDPVVVGALALVLGLSEG